MKGTLKVRLKILLHDVVSGKRHGHQNLDIKAFTSIRQKRLEMEEGWISWK